MASVAGAAARWFAVAAAGLALVACEPGVGRSLVQGKAAATVRAVAPAPRAQNHTSPRTVLPECRRYVLLGWSVQHRAITACERGTPGGVGLLVVGNIHGDERIGWGVVLRLEHTAVPAGVDLWLVLTVNPDGSAHDTRSNARGVDENRNWPYRWTRSVRGSPTYGGPWPLSEPETQALRRFLARVRPHTVVVFHSPLDCVDFSDGGDPAVTWFLARASGYPAKQLGGRPGVLTGWFNAQPWGGDAVTFEFGRSATSKQLDRVARAVLALGRWRTGGALSLARPRGLSPLG
jgi:murein peptide amidase A